VAQLQARRLGEGLSPRTVNCEVATLRQILKHYGCWTALAGRVRFLREKTDSGRALSLEEEEKLLQAILKSTSAVLYPLFILSLDAGLRPSESRALRRRDLNLRSEDRATVEGEIVVSHSKTVEGTGRVVPLTKRACHALTAWFLRFRTRPLTVTSFRSIGSALRVTVAGL
jgi:integrase